MKPILMKPILEEFWCPQCGQLRYVNTNGICIDCRNENFLEEFAQQRKLDHKIIIENIF